MIAIALRIDWMLIKKRSNVFRGSEKFTSRYHVDDVRTRLGSKLCPSAASRSGVNSFGLALEEISRALMGLFRSVRANGPNSIPNDSITGLATDRGFDPLRTFGLFLGTSVSTLGNFTAGPTYEPFAGIQLYAGATFWNKNTLLPNVTACSGYGNSASFTVTPASTSTSTTSSTVSETTTVTTTTTTIATTATSGCTNGDKPTIVSGTASPTQSNLKPAFSFGILFNTSLFKSFSGLK